MATLPDLTPALPEIFLACAGMALLLLGVYRDGNNNRLISWLSVAALAITAVLVTLGPAGRVEAFHGLFLVDGFGSFAKLLVLTATALSIIVSMRYLKNEGIDRFEYPVLLVFACVGMLGMISANDLISLYVGLELQSLSLYVIAAFKRDVTKSSEAGLKYFVLGALSSGLLLYGASLVYGFAGTTNFTRLASLFVGDAVPPVGVVVGLVFVMAGLAFKISAVPFHMWTPDVYEGAPTSVTAFFAVAPKIAAMALFIRVLVQPFGDLHEQWQQIVIVIALASMLLGALAAIQQRNIKRLMAYSSIGHIGYALVGLAAGTESGIQAVLVYLAIYLVMNVGTFAIILSMRVNGRMVENIDDLSGLSRSNPGLAIALAVFMWSMAGVPPAAGFWGKFLIFKAAVGADLVWLAVVMAVTSVISCFYYLRIIKVAYFDDPGDAIDRPGRVLSLVVAGTALFTFPVFFVVASPILSGAAAAAGALFHP